MFVVVVVQLFSHVQFFAAPWTATCQDSLSFTISWSMFKLMSIESVMPSNHLILCCPLLLLPSVFSIIWVFSNESALCIRWPKILELQLQHQSFQWIFRVDFLYDWLVWSPWSPRDSQESSPIPQFKSISSSALNFFIIQLSHLYMTTGKTISLTRQTFAGKVNVFAF